MSAPTRYSLSLRRVALLAAASFFVTAWHASAQWWDPSSPIAPGKWAVDGRNFKYTDKTYERATQLIDIAIFEGDFAKLDRMHDEFLEMFKAGGNGRQMLGAFGPALQNGFSGESPEKYAKLFADWRARAPESKLRPVAEAAMWFDLAWGARGNGYASGVSQEAARIFQDRLARAARVLEEGQAQGRGTPLWHWLAVSTAGSAGEPDAVLDAFVADGAKRFPPFLPLFATRLNFLLPQWGGDYDRVDAFIRRAVRLTDAREGTVLYARLYEQVHATFHGEDFFRETRASWPLMRHAFEDEAAQNSLDLNHYATYACMARDRETTAQLLRELGDDANLGVGMEGLSTETCEQLVKEGR